MSLKAGRRGLNKRLVDAFGKLNGEAPSGEYYTKQQTDNKFETKTHVNNTFQKKTLEVPLEMLSGSKLTVEDALQGLNEEKFTYADNGVLGAKNLLKNEATSQTINGVTFTVNDDGSVTANGTATADAELILVNTQILSANIPYILNGCPNGGSSEKYRLQYRCGSIYINDMGEGKSFTLSSIEGTTYVKCIVSNGYTANNLTFYPMLRKASDPDDTYVPYAMTNRELTEEFTVQKSAVTDVVATTVNKNKLFKYGKVVQLMLDLSGVTIAENGVIAKVPLDFRPIEQIMISVRQSSGSLFCNVMGGGDIKPLGSLSNTNCQLYATWITN